MFYLSSGLVGALAHVAFNFASLVPIFVFLTTVELPAYIMLLYWTLMQFISGTVPLAMSDASAGGVAWLAHIGGFLGGIVLLFLLRKGRRW